MSSDDQSVLSIMIIVADLHREVDYGALWCNVCVNVFAS